MLQAARESKGTLDSKVPLDSRERKEIKAIQVQPGLIRPLQWQERLRRQRRRACRLRRRRYQRLSRRPGAVLAPLALLASQALRAIRVRPARLLPSKDPPGKPDNPILVPRAVQARLALLVRQALLVHLDPPIPNY